MRIIALQNYITFCKPGKKVLLLCVKKLKHIRIILSLLMLVECTAPCLLGISAPEHARVAGYMQLSARAVTVSIAATAGAWLLWMCVTLLLGRVYCASFCPAGTVQDILVRCKGTVTRRPARWRKHPARPVRWWVLAAYAAAVMAGAGMVPMLIEPWPAFVNVIQQASGQGEAAHNMAASIGTGALWGAVCAIVSAILLLAYALASGRDFCNDVCPIGSILALAASRPAMHMALYPDRCTSCLRCEDVCKGGCIDIKTRHIDEARCLRCFNCIAVCPDDAIKFQLNPNGIMTPMLRSPQSSV